MWHCWAVKIPVVVSIFSPTSQNLDGTRRCNSQPDVNERERTEHRAENAELAGAALEDNWSSGLSLLMGILE